VQAAAYTEKSKARRVRSKLGRLARSQVTAVQIRRTIFYRVRLGPVNTTAEGDRLLARVVAMGYRNARVVIDPARR
jgi:cell division protein FtsN